MDAKFDDENNPIPADRSKKFKNLLAPSKVLRDPIHGDIFLTDLELTIINTKGFQRLHSIKQLGLAYLVYPGANHTRFAHSIGTLYMAQKIIDAINKNPFHRVTITDSYQVALTRVCALLHNIGSVPFGHAIEDGNLIPDDWKDQERIEYFLGSDSEIGQILLDTTSQEFLDDLKATLVARKDDEIGHLKYPFISDIVKNGLCADLLDYIGRDAYHVGSKESFDSRLLRYLFIQDNEPEKGRLMLNVSPRGKIRRDVVTGFIDLIETYCSLAEKVWFHRTKLSASAMLAKSVAATPWVTTHTRFLYESRDDELLYELEKNGSETSKYIISRLRRRQVYKPIYAILSDVSSHPRTAAKVVEGLLHKFRKPLERDDFEQKLEEQSNLPSGSIVLYCPHLNISIPAVRTRILWRDHICTIDNVPEKEIKRKIDNMLERYKRLFRIFVFMDPELAKQEPLARNVFLYCQRSLLVSSQLDLYQRMLPTQVPPTQQLPDQDIIETLKQIISSQGFNIFEEKSLPGLPGYSADLVARKGEQYYVFEVKRAKKPPDERELVNYLVHIGKAYSSYLSAKSNILGKEQAEGEVNTFLVLVDIEPTKELRRILRNTGIGLVLLSSDELWRISKGLMKADELSIAGLN